LWKRGLLLVDIWGLYCRWDGGSIELGNVRLCRGLVWKEVVLGEGPWLVIGLEVGM